MCEEGRIGDSGKGATFIAFAGKKEVITDRKKKYRLECLSEGGGGEVH